MDERWKLRILFDNAKRKLMVERQMSESEAFYFLAAEAGIDDPTALGEAARRVLDGTVEP